MGEELQQIKVSDFFFFSVKKNEMVKKKALTGSPWSPGGPDGPPGPEAPGAPGVP